MLSVLPFDRLKKNRTVLFLGMGLGLFFLSLSNRLVAAPGGSQKIILEGRVLDGLSRQPVDFAVIVVPQLRAKQRVLDGTYRLEFPKPGTYFLRILGEGQKLETNVRISGDSTRDFVLRLATVRGKGILVKGDRDVQKISRYTMTVKQLKEVPATFGDSIGALASLPGINRATAGGFFGPLIIRGAFPEANQYFLDDIPLLNPQHFGGFHSVVNNNLMREIDLYSSAFPAEFENANGAVININTIDQVEGLGGYADIGAISANALIKGNWDFKRQDQLNQSAAEQSGEKKEPRGYWVAAGRLGYFSLLVPTFTRLLTGEAAEQLPEYWDYQFKGKWYFTGEHALTLLMFGSFDTFAFVDDNEDFQEARADAGADPLLNDFEFDTDLNNNSQGIYYTWQPSKKMSSRLLAYSSLNETLFYFYTPNSKAFQKINISSRPNIFGLKERFKWDYLPDYSQLRLGLEYGLFNFISSGQTIVPRAGTGSFDFGEEDSFVEVPVKEDFTNNTLGGYAENKLTLGGLKFVPGVRWQYLDKTEQSALDYRGLLAYTFPTDTVFSLAGGTYSNFPQINPDWFTNQPEVAGEALEPEKANHTSVGLEQTWGFWKIKAEGFYNYHYDLVSADPHMENGELIPGDNLGKLVTWGGEFSLFKDQNTKKKNDYYGWISYTLAKSSYRSGARPSNDPYGREYLPGPWDQRHAMKAVLGYIFGRNTLGARFQLFTSYPYTPITGSSGPDRFFGRYSPEYGKPFSSRFAPDHRLDIRYSRKTFYEWGYLSWYVEVINIYNKTGEFQDWRYNSPYRKGRNPRIEAPDDSITIIPNFGLEVKF